MKPEVIRASVLGFCMGVRRAVDMAEKSLAENPGARIYSYGPLIHNRSALESLEKRGLHCINSDEELESVKASAGMAEKPPVIIIRAHGIPPEKRLSIAESGCSLVDATCPRVLANQKKAASYAREGYTVILAGDRNHGELAALEGCVRFEGAECILAADRNDAEKIELVAEKAVLIGQTTISRSEYEAIASVLSRKLPSLKVIDTMCPATTERQQALAELCGQVDGVIIVGGRNSANTIRLFMAAKENCPNAVHIENASEIPEAFFSLGKVGIAAGASTPDGIIEAVEKALLS